MDRYEKLSYRELQELCKNTRKDVWKGIMFPDLNAPVIFPPAFEIDNGVDDDSL